MTRIISGAAGGLRLRTPPGTATRPTSDRVREALFSRLNHEDVLAGARVLDLYAGSGALGLEAASRGAGHVLLVESDRATAEVIRANAALLARAGVSAPLQVRGARVERVLATAAPQPYDVVLADPPYPTSEDTVAQVLAALVTNDWLSEGALVVVERSTRSPQPRWPDGLGQVDSRRYGETTIWFATRLLAS